MDVPAPARPPPMVSDSAQLSTASDRPPPAAAASRAGPTRGPDGYYRITPTLPVQHAPSVSPAASATARPSSTAKRSTTPPGHPTAEQRPPGPPLHPAPPGQAGDQGATFGNSSTTSQQGAVGGIGSGEGSSQPASASGGGGLSIRLRLSGGEGPSAVRDSGAKGAGSAGEMDASNPRQFQSSTSSNSPTKPTQGPSALPFAPASAIPHTQPAHPQHETRQLRPDGVSLRDGDHTLRSANGAKEDMKVEIDGEGYRPLSAVSARERERARERPRHSEPSAVAGPSRSKAPRETLSKSETRSADVPHPGSTAAPESASRPVTMIKIAPRPATTNPVAGPSMPTPLPSAAPAGPSTFDADGDSIMRDAAEGLVQEQRRSLRGRAARIGATGDGGSASGEGGSEMRLIAGVNASGKGVKVGGSAKIGTGPGGVQRKKKKGDVDVPNQDFCSACRGVGRFLCCDGCPRSFHFMCLEPPLRVDELPDEETWYCKKCRQDMTDTVSRSTPTPTPGPGPWGSLAAVPTTPNGTSLPPHTFQKHRSVLTRPIPAAFRMMIKRLDEDNPMQFRLPQDVRTYFAGVGDDAVGNYVEEVEVQKLRYDRKGYLEERDPNRLKDFRSRPVACYVCGGSSVPMRSLATDPDPAWRPIVSCNYCSLHWHFDCLNPPLVTAPNLLSGKRWMCPNHAEQVMPRRRTVRSGIETVDIDDLGVPNNGNVIIVPEKTQRTKLEYEEIMVNKRKYRVPERIIQLDFLDRLKGKGRANASSEVKSKKKLRRSGSESSLTSLDSESGLTNDGDMEAAAFLMGLASAPPTAAATVRPPPPGAAPANDRMDIDPPEPEPRPIPPAAVSTTPPGEPTATLPHATHLAAPIAPAVPTAKARASPIAIPAQSGPLANGAGAHYHHAPTRPSVPALAPAPSGPSRPAGKISIVGWSPSMTPAAGPSVLERPNGADMRSRPHPHADGRRRIDGDHLPDTADAAFTSSGHNTNGHAEHPRLILNFGKSGGGGVLGPDQAPESDLRST